MKNIINKTSISVACAVMLVAGTAFAQDLMGLDADGNGSVSKEEAAANEDLMGRWDELDADGNGELSAEELAAAAG